MGLVRARSLVVAQTGAPGVTNVLLATVPALTRWKLEEISWFHPSSGAWSGELRIQRGAASFGIALVSFGGLAGAASVVSGRTTVLEPADNLRWTVVTAAAVELVLSGYELALP